MFCKCSLNSRQLFILKTYVFTQWNVINSIYMSNKNLEYTASSETMLIYLSNAIFILIIYCKTRHPHYNKFSFWRILIIPNWLEMKLGKSNLHKSRLTIVSKNIYEGEELSRFYCISIYKLYSMYEKTYLGDWQCFSEYI